MTSELPAEVIDIARRLVDMQVAGAKRGLVVFDHPLFGSYFYIAPSPSRFGLYDIPRVFPPVLSMAGTIGSSLRLAVFGL